MHFPLIFIKHICLDVMFARCVLDSDIVVIRIVGLVFFETLVSGLQLVTIRPPFLVFLSVNLDQVNDIKKSPPVHRLSGRVGLCQMLIRLYCPPYGLQFSLKTKLCFCYANNRNEVCLCSEKKLYAWNTCKSISKSIQCDLLIQGLLVSLEQPFGYQGKNSLYYIFKFDKAIQSEASPKSMVLFIKVSRSRTLVLINPKPVHHYFLSQGKVDDVCSCMC